MQFGMLLPHFGEYATPERLVQGSVRLEELGYDSVWVRDHLLWKPHEMEGQNRNFVEPFITLAAIAGSTSRIKLGTAVLIPIRWPLKVAQNLASLSWIAGGRVIFGVGMGSNQAELSAAGFSVENREAIFEETVQICREVWSKDDVTWSGKHFQFENVTIYPKPAEPIEIWYGGTTRASVRRAVNFCDGWLPGRLNLATIDNRIKYLDEQNVEKGRTAKWGLIPIVSIDRDRDKARQSFDIDALATSSAGSATWIKPPSGQFRTIEDLEGLLMAGNPEDIVSEIRKLEVRGIEHLVFDLRLMFDRYEETAELLAMEVMPNFQ